ncbi:DUF4962 domain-containing protein [Cohnella sp. CFH 77786]|uniref:DUF4962 domain-containing protein n=1 Tax=Cohnella sp. CFH 77786 TaxID=2662265 RepID=UPI001C609580|nr:DUF4962 domain-containing protein [Cohnella sp. CFH 77786]MBW5447722.1 DUF4962 domain-containing protein [Cohnella sp. CFH 77786]
MIKAVLWRKPAVLILILALIFGLSPLSFKERVAQAAIWPYGTELVANGNFEKIVNGFPVNWTPMNAVPEGSLTMIEDNSAAASGIKTLKIFDNGEGGAREVGVKSDPISIVYGQTYTAKVKAKVSLGRVHLLVRTYDSNGNPSTQQYIADSTSTAGVWETLSVTFSPPQSHSATAVIHVYERTTTAYTTATIDDVTMSLSGNLVPNGGFEIDPGPTDNFPVGWLPMAEAKKSFVTTETSLANVSAGKRSVKFTDDINNISAVGQIGIQTGFISIRPGETFDIQVKVKVPQGKVGVMARSFDSNGNWVQHLVETPFESSDEWQKISFSYTPKAPYTSTFRLMIYERSEMKATTAYVDEVSVTSSELLFNPSFESGTGTAIEGWTVVPAGGVTWVTAQTDPIDQGSKAVKFTNTASALQSIPVRHERGYAFTASVKAYVTSGKAKLTLQSLNWAGAPLPDSVATVQSDTGQSGWQTLKVTLAPPNWAAKVRVVLTTDSASDTVVFDSAQLRFGWPITSPGDQTMPFRPADRAASEQNPPDFSWTYVDGADQYELQIASDASFATIVYSKDGIPVNLFNLPSTLTAGTSYYWRVRYHYPQGWSAWSDTRQFRIKQGAVAFTVPDIETLINSVLDVRPRILTTPSTLNVFKVLKDNEGKPIYDFAKSRVDDIIASPSSHPIQEPSAGDSVAAVNDVVLREMTNILSGALVYMITDDAQYKVSILDVTKPRLMAIAGWNPNGSTSYQTADQASRDIALLMAVAYDWLKVPSNGAFSDTERQTLVSAIHARTKTIYDDILDAASSAYLYKDPYHSHGWTAAGYVAIIATAMMHEPKTVNGVAMAEHAKKWFRQAVPVRINMYPPIGGEEGGWATGTGYWEVSHLADKRVADVLKEATQVNLYQKAFSRNEHNMVTYFMPVGSPGGQFGDGSEKPMKQETVNLLRRQAQVYDPNPISQWAKWSEAAAPVSLDPYKLFSYGYGKNSVRPRPPFELPSARWQKDVGWVAMHSSLYDPERISLYFKSSGYGSYNHSHADQNSFTINAFGEKLAIDAGYFDGYETPFHNQYYRTTLAHNAITYVDNTTGQKIGQKINHMKASGRIAGFASIGAFDGTVGDATQAYNQDSALPGLDLARRGIIYVKPNAFVVIDKLDAKGAASVPFEYLLHSDSYSSIMIDGHKQEATIRKNQAAMKVQIQYPAVLNATKDDKFRTVSDTEISPNPDPSTPMPLQWHAKFTFPSAQEQTIISTYQPYRQSTPSAITTQTDTNKTYQSLAFADGTMVYVRLAGSGLVTVNSNFKFDGMAAVVRGSDVLLLDGVRLEKNGVTLIQSMDHIPATIALSGSEVSISGDTPELGVQVNTAATKLYDETYAKVTSGGTAAAGMGARGVYWTKTGNVMTIQSESGRRFMLRGANDPAPTAPGSQGTVNLTVKLNNTVIDTYSLAGHGTYAGGTASYGQLTGLQAGTYTIVSAPAGLKFEKGGAATPGLKTLGASPWVILDGGGGTLELTN